MNSVEEEILSLEKVLEKLRLDMPILEKEILALVKHLEKLRLSVHILESET